jgi:hypothetical protein
VSEPITIAQKFRTLNRRSVIPNSLRSGSLISRTSVPVA